MWGFTASAVWAGGGSGTALFWDGATWKDRSLPTYMTVWSLGGSSPQSVFASVNDSLEVAMWHFNGSRWENLGLFAYPHTHWSNSIGCVAGLGPSDALISLVEPRPGPGLGDVPARVLYRVTSSGGNWTKTKLGEFLLTPEGAGDRCSIQVLGADDYVVSGFPTMRWSAGAFTELGSTSVRTGVLYAPAANAAVGVVDSSTVSALDAQGWSTLDAGFDATGVHGTGSARVFVVGKAFGFPFSPRVSLWDGLEFSPLPMPAGTAGSLNAVWAAPTGEVVAVGEYGLVLRGP